MATARATLGKAAKGEMLRRILEQAVRYRQLQQQGYGGITQGDPQAYEDSLSAERFARGGAAPLLNDDLPRALSMSGKAATIADDLSGRGLARQRRINPFLMYLMQKGRQPY